ncbi:MAG TPA: FliH/SctL family protein [Burkholderiaceae bacterium]|jgi:flagellar assembly protein FliH|nr:FliH/SctL family protein [Burkholderiaceae bacterium]
MSSSKAPPAPSAPGARATQSRFIPREELSDFAAWRPGAFGNAKPPSPHPSGKPVEREAQPAPAPASTPEPTEADWLEAVQRARDAGYQDGYRDGLVALDAFKASFAKQMSDQFGQMLACLDGQWNELEPRMADAVMRTAVQLARQVVRDEIKARPEIITQVAQEAVGAIVLSARHLRVHVNPADHAHVAEGCAEALKARDARVVADASVEPGGVLVKSDLGQVDARIGSRWAQAAAVFGRADPWPDDDGGEAEAPDAPSTVTPVRGRAA